MNNNIIFRDKVLEVFAPPVRYFLLVALLKTIFYFISENISFFDIINTENN